VLIIFSTVFGLIGASLGWWKDTRVLYRRPGSKWTTDLVPKEKIRSSILSRRRRKRLMTTVEFGVYGAIFGTALFWTLQRFVK
jgi:uncharacterized membrane protein YeaQ/YmgE (transglycosylase-associated protein family)